MILSVYLCYCSEKEGFTDTQCQRPPNIPLTQWSSSKWWNPALNPPSSYNQLPFGSHVAPFNTNVANYGSNDFSLVKE